MNDFNRALIAEFRATGGKMDSQSARKLMAQFRHNRTEADGQSDESPLLLLTTIGAKSGQPRTNPLAYITDGDRIAIIASDRGAPRHPDWYYNLLANPVVTVEKGSERFQAQAVAIAGQERERLYAKMAEQFPAFAEYQRKTGRQIPVVLLQRVG
jgi:deazaflavin-dependent oxidoreductase (nitroreductase family)